MPMPHLSHRFGASLATLLVLLGALGAFAPLAMAQAPSPTPPGGAPGGQSQTAEYKPDALDRTVGWLMNKIASLFAWLLGVAAITLDYVVFYTVIKMGDFVSSVQGVENIGIAWRVLRDIGNIALIFGFLASGIMVIVNASYFGFGSKMLPMLLVAAVFINFSLFISSAIIDVGNIFATQIYTQINNGVVPTPEMMKEKFLKSPSNEGISNRIMSVLGLAQTYQTSSAGGDTIKGSALSGSGPWYIGFMAILLFIIAAFVFFSLAFILVARFVALIFLIIIAPLGFAGLAIPKLAGLANQWWGHLVEQTLTAPVLLLLLYVALAVITDEMFLPKGGGFDANATAAGAAWQGFLKAEPGSLGNFASVLLAFIIAMGLLLAVIVPAKRMSAFGAGAATKLAGAATLGAVAYGARGTVGWGSQSLSRKLQSSRLARVPILGRGLARGLGYGAKASFDVRGTSLLKNIGGIEAGTAQKGGYRKEEEDAIKAREAYAKDLQLSRPEREERARIETQRRQAEERARRTETQHATETRLATNQHRADIVPLVDDVNNTRSALDTARRGGNLAATATAQTAYDVANRAYQTRRDQQEAELAQQRSVQGPVLQAQKRAVEMLQEQANAINRQPQETYGRRLGTAPISWMNRNKKAAENIIAHARKWSAR